MRAAGPSDTIVVCRLDRLARSTRDLLNVLDRLGKGGVGFRSLRETAVHSTTVQGRLVVSILAAISEFEREIILSRITEGRKRARQNGIRCGRKP
jgi:DNA invertase Pin-like site-specific DNA recombinase